MVPNLLCVVVEAGAAAYLKPVLEAWVADPPEFAWRVRATGRARGILGDCVPTAYLESDPLQRESSDAAAFYADAVLVSAGGWPIEHAHVLTARTSGVPAMQFIDTWYNYRHRLIRNGEWILPDRIFVIDDAAVAEAAEEGVPRTVLDPVGHPGWEGVVPLPSTTSRDVLFVDAPVRRDYGDRLGYDERDAWHLLCEAAERHPNLVGRILYAPHPEQHPSDHVTGAAVTRYDRSLLDDIETLVGMFSAPLVDAYLAGRRVVSLQPGANAVDMCPLSRHGRIRRARDMDELAAALAAPPPDANGLAAALDGSARRVSARVREALAA